MERRLLLVEDDSAFRKVYGRALRDAGISVVEADDRPSAKAKLDEGEFDVVMLDLMLPPDGTVEGGLRQLEQIVRDRPGTKVIVASGAGDSASMLKAIRAGAHDFLTKPVDPDVLLVVIERVLQRVRLERELDNFQTQLANASPETTMIGASSAFLNAVQLTERVAKSELPILITGENGTGKELLARSAHQWSPRREGRFVAVNCGAIPETLLESTFFGHKRGAFTGAVRDEPGLFREADGGSLFLDEIGDMPVTLQVKVLRAVEYGEILPVGAAQPVRVDVRIISATNHDLEALVESGSFREDLYWRIKGAEIRLPPLRDRKTDIPLLASYFLNRAAHLCPDGRPRLLSDAALAALESHDWHGNLRELRHEMQRATVFCGSRREIEPEDLSFTGSHERPDPNAAGDQTLHEKVAALEKQEIAAALEANQDNRSRAAADLGLSRQGLLKKMERYGLR